jgi:dsRNA-specific ribonuclease
VSNKALERLGRQHKLEDYIVNNPSQQGKVSRTALASTIIGAVWIDSNKELQKVEAVVNVLEIFKQH